MYFMDYPFTSCLETLNGIYYTVRGDIPIKIPWFFPDFYQKMKFPDFSISGRHFQHFPDFPDFSLMVGSLLGSALGGKAQSLEPVHGPGYFF